MNRHVELSRIEPSNTNVAESSNKYINKFTYLHNIYIYIHICFLQYFQYIYMCFSDVTRPRDASATSYPTNATRRNRFSTIFQSFS